jgi:type I restriction enzyme, S subunit
MAGDMWHELPIGETGRVVTGRTPPGTLPEFFGDYVPFLTPSDMDGRRRIAVPARSLSARGAKTLERVIVPCGVAVSCIGWQMGKAVLIDRPTVTNQQINTVVPDAETVDSLFLFYSLTARRNELFNLGSGGSRTPILNKSGFESVRIRLPPLPEQKAIAHILGTLDDKIELNRRMNETLEAMARALFKSWFVDFDPVRAKMDGRQPEGMDKATADLFPDSFEDSTLGKIPKGWEVRSLDEIADFLNGLALQKYPPVGDGDVPVIKIAQLRSGNTSGSDLANREVPPQYVIEDGDVLFSWSGTLEVRVWCGGVGALNQHLFKVTSPSVPKWFYYHWTLEHLPGFQAIAASKATTMGHIQRHHLKEAECVVPPATTLARLDKEAAPLLSKVVDNECESRTLAALRDALLPKLLSGEIQVRSAEDMVGRTI